MGTSFVYNKPVIALNSGILKSSTLLFMCLLFNSRFAKSTLLSPRSKYEPTAREVIVKFIVSAVYREERKILYFHYPSSSHFGNVRQELRLIHFARRFWHSGGTNFATVKIKSFEQSP